MPGWLVATPLPSLPWSGVERVFNTTALPCEGGQFGASSPTVSVCELSEASTIMPSHMPHFMQSFLPCWSLFQYHATGQCAFLVGDGEAVKLTDFARWIVEKSGCMLLPKRPDRCAYVSTYKQQLSVGPGESFSWLHHLDAAKRLQTAVLGMRLRDGASPNKTVALPSVGVVVRKN